MLHKTMQLTEKLLFCIRTATFPNRPPARGTAVCCRGSRSASDRLASITGHQCHRTIPRRISRGTDYSIVKVRERILHIHGHEKGQISTLRKKDLKNSS